jgi:hypothetical protein
MESILQNETSRFRNQFLSPAVWALAALFIMTFIMGLVKIYSPDLGFHLKSAEWIVNHKQFIHTDSFSYGSQGNSYYDMQWLFQLVIYGVYNMGGDAALVVVNALLITMAMGLALLRFTRSSETGITNMSLALFAFMAILFVQPLTFEIRPHVFSWIYLHLLLLFLASYKKGNKKSLYTLPVIMLFWANTHSLSILGLVTIGIYNAGMYLEQKKWDKQLLLFSGIAGVAFLMTPYFFGGLWYAFSQFGLVSGTGDNLLKDYIGELHSPFSSAEIERLGSKYFTSPLMLMHLSAIVSIFCICRSFRKKQFTDTILLLAYLVILYMANKNYGYFIMASLPLFVKYSLDWIETRKAKKGKQKTVLPDKRKNKLKEEQKPVPVVAANSKLYKRLTYTTIIIAVIISITSITDGYAIFRHSPYRFGFTTDKDQLPVDAVAFLKKNQVKGKVLNHMDFGGYLMAHYSEQVFIDGRMDVLPEGFFKKYYESLTVRNKLKKLLDEYNPDIMIFPYVKAYYWWEYFLEKGTATGYKPVYFDGLSVVYVKSSAYPQLAMVSEKDILAAADATAINRLHESIEVSKPGTFMALISGLWQKQSFAIADQNKAIYCFTNGFNTAGLNYSVISIENSTVRTPNIFKNLAIYYQDKKMYGEAQLCADKSE